jgi:hypothetical protein
LGVTDDCGDEIVPEWHPRNRGCLWMTNAVAIHALLSMITLHADENG